MAYRCNPMGLGAPPAVRDACDRAREEEAPDGRMIQPMPHDGASSLCHVDPRSRAYDPHRPARMEVTDVAAQPLCRPDLGGQPATRPAAGRALWSPRAATRRARTVSAQPRRSRHAGRACPDLVHLPVDMAHSASARAR